MEMRAKTKEQKLTQRVSLLLTRVRKLESWRQNVSWACGGPTPWWMRMDEDNEKKRLAMRAKRAAEKNGDKFRKIGGK